MRMRKRHESYEQLLTSSLLHAKNSCHNLPAAQKTNVTSSVFFLYISIPHILVSQYFPFSVSASLYFLSLLHTKE